MLNDPEGAIAALDMGADPSAADGLGRTTAEVAMMAGSEAVTRALEAREGSRGRASGEDGEGEDDDSNYVYEVYRLETSSVGDYGEAGDTETAVGASEVDGDRTAVCDSDGNGKGKGDGEGGPHRTVELELRGGVGYWNEAGELVLEAEGPKSNGEGREGSDGDSDVMDDDEDSNDEAHGGNDYPDEDEGYGGGGSGADGGEDWDNEGEDEDEKEVAYFGRYEGGPYEDGRAHSPNGFDYVSAVSPRVMRKYGHGDEEGMASSDDDEEYYSRHEFRDRPIPVSSLAVSTPIQNGFGPNTSRVNDDPDNAMGGSEEVMVGVPPWRREWKDLGGGGGIAERAFAYDPDLDYED